MVEIIVVSAIVVTALVGFLQAEITSLRLLETEKYSLQASFLAQEGLEAARTMRDESWSNIASTTLGAVYSPVMVNGKWSLVSATSTVGIYSRTLAFNQVSRDADDNILSSGTVDPGTLQAVSTVSWNTPQGLRQTQLTEYLTNFQSFLPRSGEIKSIYSEDADTDADLANFPSSDASGDPAQSFTTQDALKLTKLELYLRKGTTSPSDIYAEIRESATGPILGTSVIINSVTLADSLSWIEFRFPDFVSLATSTQYYIRLHSLPDSTVAGAGVGPVIWGYKQIGSTGPYAGGEARIHIGQGNNPDDAGQVLNQYDFGFRIYKLLP